MKLTCYGVNPMWLMKLLDSKWDLIAIIKGHYIAENSTSLAKNSSMPLNLNACARQMSLNFLFLSAIIWILMPSTGATTNEATLCDINAAMKPILALSSVARWEFIYLVARNC